MRSLLRDLRFGLRIFSRNPAFSLTAVFITALGVAAACGILSFAEAAVVRALPYRSPANLAAVSMTDARFSHAWDQVSAPVFLNWREHAGSIGGFAASERFLGQTLAGVPEPAQVFDYGITPGAFSLLGAEPALGRGFIAADYNPGSPPVILLSDALWRQLFHGSRAALGRVVTLDGASHTIVGVMPPGFIMPGASAWAPVCWTPLRFSAKERSDAQTRSLSVWARLRVPPARAQAALTTLALQVMNSSAGKDSKGPEWRIHVTPLTDVAMANWRSALIVLFGAAGLLLAIACVNVASLLLARAGARRQEIAVRTAIGASRSRILRQLLTESVLLGGAGGALGLLLAHWGIVLESHLLPQSLLRPNFLQMGIDPRVLVATLAIALAAGVAFGLAPAVYAARLDLVESLKEGGASVAHQTGGILRRVNLRSVLIVAEVALSLVLLTGAGLMLRSFLKLENVHSGLNPRQVLTMRVLLPRYRFAAGRAQLAAYEETLRRVQALPGIEAAGFISPLPLDGINGTFRDKAQPGMTNVDQGGVITGGLHAVSPGYFKAMGIPLLAGRDFSARDTPDSARVLIVNQAYARRYWAGQNPVGKGGDAGGIVGVVGNVRDSSLAEEPRPEVYMPYTQKLFAAFAGTIVVKTVSPAATAVALQKTIHALEPDAPIGRIETMRQVLSVSVSDKRFYLLLVGVFALLALVLAVAGIAGATAYAAGRRTREIGIRMALGARRGDILRMLMKETFVLALIGVAVGVAGALALTRFVSGQLYGVSATDPVTYIAVAAAFLAVSLIAAAIPALRASSADPSQTLRAS